MKGLACKGMLWTDSIIIVFFQKQQAGELVAQTTTGAFYDVLFQQIGRVPHGSDLRLRSQDGKSEKEEAPKLLANQPVYWWPEIQVRV